MCEHSEQQGSGCFCYINFLYYSELDFLYVYAILLDEQGFLFFHIFPLRLYEKAFRFSSFRYVHFCM